MSYIQISPNNDCFKSRRHELIYILVNTESYHRMKLLGVTPEHFRNINIANSWKEGIDAELLGKKSISKDYGNAVMMLGKIYSDMQKACALVAEDF